ncbi:Rossmann-like and DUF2520 domain-containing protein [Arenibacter latericius]|uniref:Rossmann-like and DUF2520 domain-containing protein n=1 Tax=Arenibacter latericius TaxID=86104 RepID=UPI0004168F7B|nr:DUF2520 domain-containing protein [Arenibacter latericius]MDX1364254.1 DUF2520 domain-containing protein [Arenibacter latericius]
MISIIILGSGNVAKHLFDTFLGQNEINILQVIGRNKDHLSYFKSKVEVSNDFNTIQDADLYLIAVSDDAIPEVAKTLRGKKGIVAHCSGSVPLKALDPINRRAVFYPLQSFSAGKKIDFKSVPICIEAENKNDLNLLEQLGNSISNNVQEVSSEQRKSLHLAAVFVNNFTNHLFHIGHEICEDNDLPFHILLPLIKETVKKLDYITPLNAQTGPARRNDRSTIENHLNQLKTKNNKDIYTLLSKSISEKYRNEL